jgi:oxygen-independent coproporphyrinogen-3 oxidase
VLLKNNNMNIESTLITKYNKAVPRYTSYPTVPHWQDEIPTESQWLSAIKNAYNEAPGISLYIHLPFCEALCTYCGCNKRITKNHNVEEPYIDTVIKEWSIYRAQFEEPPMIKEIHLGGGTPTFFEPKQLERLLTAILADCEVAEEHEFSFEAHPNSTSYGHLKCLYDLSFRRISIGVQDVSPNILKAINREQTSDEVRGLTKWSRAIGYTSINYDIIYGLPFQKPVNIMDTAAFIAETKPDRIAFYSYAHVPWKSASQRAFTLDDVPSGIYKSDLYDLGRYLLESEGYEAIGMDHFCLPNEGLNRAYQKGEMHRNFMGYTANYTKCSIALGASSISDSWDVYVQNEKNIEKYQEIINSGKLPITKGHVLTDSETTMRKHILNLMCKDSTTWDLISKDAIAITPFLSNLDELVADDLVRYKNNQIKVTEKGKYFIRNICAALDPIFQNTEVDSPLFSKAI